MYRKILLPAFIAMAMLTACKKDAPVAQTPPAPMVIVHEVTEEAVAERESFIGKVDAVTKAAITARVSGFLEQRLVQEGQMVQKGQLLFVIEKSQYQAVVKQSEAALAQAKANENNARLQRDRGKALLTSAGISQSAYDNLEAAYAVAAANVTASQAALDTAKLNLSYTDVLSPIAGKVGFIVPNIGETVTPAGGVLTTVIAPMPMNVVFTVTDRQMQALRLRFSQGDNITMDELIKRVNIRLNLSDGSEYSEKGLINFVDNTVDAYTDSISVRARFENKDSLLANGQTVGVSIVSEKAIPQVVAPQAAILNDISGKYVFVVKDDNITERRALVVGDVLPPAADGKVYQVVTSGLKAGERIIVDGVQKVRTASPVKPMTQDEYNKMIEEQTAQ